MVTMLCDLGLDDWSYYFIEGSRDDHAFGDNETKEAYKHHLIADVGDHYESLTLKVFAGINWIVNQTQGKSWIVKIDDDVHIDNPELFVRWLKLIQDSISHYFSCDKGVCKPSSPAFRRSHYGRCNNPFINKQPWHGRICNEYAGGPCYILSPSAAFIVSFKWDNPNRHNLLDDWYEDVAIAAYLADHKIKPVHTGMKQNKIISWP
jgi:hypothetical protein